MSTDIERFRAQLAAISKRTLSEAAKHRVREISHLESCGASAREAADLAPPGMVNGTQAVNELVKEIAAEFGSEAVRYAVQGLDVDVPAKPRKRYVYLMQATPSCVLKVGSSVNPKGRRATLRGGLVHDTKLSLLAKVAGSYEDEKELHKRFAAGLLDGKQEWFHYSPEIVEWFREHAKWVGPEAVAP